MSKKGDLVQTDDGYYGIVVDDHVVFLGNGLEEQMNDESWNALKPVGINVFQEGGVSNFDALVEGRAPCQDLERRRISESDDFRERVWGL